MRKSLFFIIIATFCLLNLALSAQTVRLEYNKINEISIAVNNNCAVNLEKLKLVVNREDLPNGITVEENTQSIFVSAYNKNEEELCLRITVNEDVKEGLYQIPFYLHDKEHNSWKYLLEAHVIAYRTDSYKLNQCYPNPFNNSTCIKYSIADDLEHQTKLIIYDSAGKITRILIDKKQPAGVYHAMWDGRDGAGRLVSSGIYFYQLTSGSFVNTQKMLLIK